MTKDVLRKRSGYVREELNPHDGGLGKENADRRRDKKERKEETDIF